MGLPEHIRALIVILLISQIVFYFSRKVFCAEGLFSSKEFDHLKNSWFIVLLTAFLSHSFWIFLVLAAFILSIRSRKVAPPLSLYVLILFCIPSVGKEIPGVGPIDHILAIDYYRLLNLTILLPLAIKLRSSASDTAYRPIDILVLLFLLWTQIRHASSDTIVGGARFIIYTLIDVYIPYYVASRSLKNIADFRKVSTSFVIACLIVSMIAVFEASRHWLLYTALRPALGIDLPFSLYILRGEGGPLRAVVSLDSAIVVGYSIMLSVGLYAFLSKRISSIGMTILCGFILASGLAGSLSRGPWVGCAALLLIFFFLDPRLGERLGRALVGAGFIALLVIFTPFGQTIISYLPFIGTVEPGSVEYRAMLFDTSVEVMKQNFLIGDIHFMANPILERMRQGQGIIDIVNTYLQVILPFGLVGLTLFVSPFLLAALRLKSRLRQLSDEEMERLGRALLACIVGIAITIGTVSSISAVATLYWIFLGMASRYIQMSNPSTGARGTNARTIAGSRASPKHAQ